MQAFIDVILQSTSHNPAGQPPPWAPSGWNMLTRRHSAVQNTWLLSLTLHLLEFWCAADLGCKWKDTFSVILAIVKKYSLIPFYSCCLWPGYCFRSSVERILLPDCANWYFWLLLSQIKALGLIIRCKQPGVNSQQFNFNYSNTIRWEPEEAWRSHCVCWMCPSDRLSPPKTQILHVGAGRLCQAQIDRLSLWITFINNWVPAHWVTMHWQCWCFRSLVHEPGAIWHTCLAHVTLLPCNSSYF